VASFFEPILNPEKFISPKQAYLLAITLLILALVPVTVATSLNQKPIASQAATCYDLNGDGVVDNKDVNLIHLHHSTGAGSGNYNPTYDLNNDGRVNSKDEDIELSHIGETCPPTVTFSASKTTIIKGDSSTLSWTSTRASSVNIYPLGPVPLSGKIAVKPSSTTTYKITAKGPGGPVSKSITITVKLPTSKPPPPTTKPKPPPIISYPPPTVPITPKPPPAGDKSITFIDVKLKPLSELQGLLQIKISVASTRFSQEVSVSSSTKEIRLEVAKGILKQNKRYLFEIEGQNLLRKRIHFKAADYKPTIKVGRLYLGDLNVDNKINSVDVNSFFSDIAGGATVADLNLDTSINSLDYSILVRNYGRKGS